MKKKAAKVYGIFIIVLLLVTILVLFWGNFADRNESVTENSQLELQHGVKQSQNMPDKITQDIIPSDIGNTFVNDTTDTQLLYENPTSNKIPTLAVARKNKGNKCSNNLEVYSFSSVMGCLDGKTKSFTFNGKKYSCPILLDGELLSSKECEKIKDQYGIPFCSNHDNDNWGTAVKICGGIDKLPSVEELLTINKELYMPAVKQMDSSLWQGTHNVQVVVSKELTPVKVINYEPGDTYGYIGVTFDPVLSLQLTNSIRNTTCHYAICKLN